MCGVAGRPSRRKTRSALMSLCPLPGTLRVFRTDFCGCQSITLSIGRPEPQIFLKENLASDVFNGGIRVVTITGAFTPSNYQP